MLQHYYTVGLGNVVIVKTKDHVRLINLEPDNFKRVRITDHTLGRSELHTWLDLLTGPVPGHSSNANEWARCKTVEDLPFEWTQDVADAESHESQRRQILSNTELTKLVQMLTGPFSFEPRTHFERSSVKKNWEKATDMSTFAEAVGWDDKCEDTYGTTRKDLVFSVSQLTKISHLIYKEINRDEYRRRRLEERCTPDEDESSDSLQVLCLTMIIINVLLLVVVVILLHRSRQPTEPIQNSCCNQKESESRIPTRRATAVLAN